MSSTATAQPCLELGETRRWHALRNFTVTSQGEIAYHDLGDGPAVLLIHGFPLNAYHWRNVIGQLAGERGCIAPDLLGVGYTRPVGGADLSLPGQAKMLVELLDRLEVARVDLIANDSGTGVAQLIAAHFPERVRSMLLTNGDVETNSPPEPLVPVIELARRGGFARTMVKANLVSGAAARSDQGIIGLTFADPDAVSDEAISIYLSPLVETSERAALTDSYAAALAPNPLAGLEPLLRDCRVPIALLWGTGDIFFKESDADYLAELLPDVKYVDLLQGAKLFFPEEQPASVAGAARKLWAAIA